MVKNDEVKDGRAIPLRLHASRLTSYEDLGQSAQKQYLSLAPWAWVQLESADPPGPFPLLQGWPPKSCASLQ